MKVSVSIKSALFVALAVSLILSSCGSSTSIVSSWKDPSYKAGSEKFEKVLAMVLTRNETSRRSAEDKLNQRHPRFIQSYMIFPDLESVKDEQRAEKALKEAGFDGILTLRLISKDAKQTYVPGSASPGYWGYHGAYWGGYYNPGYYQTDVNYYIECNVFSLKSDKLLWTGITSTTNPSSIDQTVNEVLYSLKNQMIKDGLIEKPTTTSKSK